MSLRPGIGATAMEDVARAYVHGHVEVAKDVVGALQHGKRLLPLGRYLRCRLRKELGRPLNGSMEDALAALQPLRELAEAYSDPQIFVKGTFNSKVFKDLIIENTEGEYRKLQAREALFKRRKQ